MIHRPRYAFSLVELSIVLVILGLLTGGILSGQSLIRAAELRSLSSDYSRYSAAVQSFRDKYFGLPGDLTNATKFWGSAGGNTADAACDALVSASLTSVCNGNGDGGIESNGAVLYNERFYAWKELANAGLIEGSYLGRSNVGSGSATGTPGIDSPRPRISNSALTFAYMNPQTSSTEVYPGSYGFNVLYFYGSVSPPLKPEEAWNLDTKFDDGKPASGRVFAGKLTGTYMPGCTDSDTASSANYALTSTSKLCGLWFGLP